MPSVIDFVVGAMLTIGALLCFASALGLLRSETAFGRIQAFAKAGTLGVGFILIGVAVVAGDFTVFTRALATAALLLINSALMSQVLAEWSNRAGGLRHKHDNRAELEVGPPIP